jgi:hypothetical protein
MPGARAQGAPGGAEKRRRAIEDDGGCAQAGEECQPVLLSYADAAFRCEIQAPLRDHDPHREEQGDDKAKGQITLDLREQSASVVTLPIGYALVSVPCRMGYKVRKCRRARIPLNQRRLRREIDLGIEHARLASEHMLQRIRAACAPHATNVEHRGVEAV